MLDNFIKKMYVKRFGEVFSKEYVDKLEKKVSELKIQIKDNSIFHQNQLNKLKNEIKDEKNFYETKIWKLETTYKEDIIILEKKISELTKKAIVETPIDESNTQEHVENVKKTPKTKKRAKKSE